MLSIDPLVTNYSPFFKISDLMVAKSFLRISDLMVGNVEEPGGYKVPYSNERLQDHMRSFSREGGKIKKKKVNQRKWPTKKGNGKPKMLLIF